MRALTWLAIVLILSTPALARKPRPLRSSSISQRKRLNINPLLTPGGTVEAEWGGLYSFNTSSLLLPSVLKYTPQALPVEFSAAFDSLESYPEDGLRVQHFSQSMLFTALASAKEGKYFDLAVAPQATVFLRGDSGVRLGGLLLARLDAAGNSMGFSINWSAATRPTDTNPAGALDVGAGYSRNLPGRFRKLSPHVNYTLEKSSGVAHLGITLEGIEYQATSRFAVDFSEQHIRSRRLETDHQALVGVTWNFGRLR